MQSLVDIREQLIHGQDLDRETARRLGHSPDPQALHQLADDIRRHFMGNRFHLCSIINARSGNCSEDCRFCAQSARYRTDIQHYDMVAMNTAMEMALDNDGHGVHRISLVTSGRSVNDPALDHLASIYQEMARRTSMDFCASMGLLDSHRARRLREMGVSRYHCNLEANRAFFPTVCTTHSWEEKVETLHHAREAGMSLCSGGIIGMGETMEDRIELAFELRELGIKSIPINILTPIAGTPFASLEPLPLTEVLTTIALFRLINPEAVIRMAGGRQQLEKEQYRCFTAGANGAIVGNYLTTAGPSINDDLERLEALGYTFAEPAPSRQ